MKRPYDRLEPVEQMALNEAWSMLLFKLGQWRDNRGPVSIDTGSDVAQWALDVLASAIMAARKPLPPEKAANGPPTRMLTADEIINMGSAFPIPKHLPAVGVEFGPYREDPISAIKGRTLPDVTR